MKKANKPMSLNLTGYRGPIKAQCEKMGIDRWFFKKHEMNFFDIPEEFDPKNLVYLTPDTDYVMTNMCKW